MPPAPQPQLERGLSRLAALAEQGAVAVMCAEEDPAHCHRSRLIGPALEARGIAVLHIRGDGRIEPPAQKRDPQLSLFDRARPRRVLFVCLGNICRSPMAAALARQMYGERIAAESAGIDPVYERATSEAVEVMREMGLDISMHRSRSVGAIDLGAFELVVAITPSIRDSLPAIAAETRVVVWDIADPYGGDLDTYRSCARAIQRELGTLADRPGSLEPTA